MIYAIMAYSMELLWDVTELALLLQRYVFVYLVLCWLSYNFKMYLTFLAVTKVFMFLRTLS